jgi:hypothetical protein
MAYNLADLDCQVPPGPGQPESQSRAHIGTTRAIITAPKRTLGRRRIGLTRVP